MSFRVIRDFVQKPVLQFLCDRSCAYNCTAAVEPGTEYNQDIHAGFIQSAVMSGWKISLHEHVCPAHVQKEQAEVTRIVIPQFRAKVAQN